MRLIATQPFTYANQVLKIGDEFETASAEDARMLLGFGKAKRASGGYGTRAMGESGSEPATSGPDLPGLQNAKEEREKRRDRNDRYRRRDMRAED